MYIDIAGVCVDDGPVTLEDEPVRHGNWESQEHEHEEGEMGRDEEPVSPDSMMPLTNSSIDSKEMEIVDESDSEEDEEEEEEISSGSFEVREKGGRECVCVGVCG